MTQRPLVIAANRLPVTRTDDGWEASPGGLVRALFPLLRESGGTWIGWTGVPDDDAEPFEIDGVQLHPVTLSADDVEAYYEGFSNDTLWPLYHDAIRESGYHEWQWDAYVKVNRALRRHVGGGRATRRDGVDPRLPPAARPAAAPRAAATTCGSGSSTTSRSRRTSCSRASRGGRRS